VPIVLKSGSLDLLEPSGPVKACNGIALLAYTCRGDKLVELDEYSCVKPNPEIPTMYVSAVVSVSCYQTKPMVIDNHTI
jgi:hypothetical protein